MVQKSASSALIGDRSVGYETKRLELLREVALAFAEDGFHRTSVNSLAARLGVSKPVLYYYAKNKEDLLSQIGQAARHELEEALDKAQQAKADGLTKLHYFFTTYADIMSSDFGRCFALVDHRTLTPEARSSDSRHRRQMEEAVREIIREGQKDGSIREVDPVLTARALFGAFNGIPRWFQTGGKLSPADVAKVYLDIFMSGIDRV